MATVEKALVLNNRKLSRDMYEMEFQAPGISRLCEPGQFVHIITGPGYDPLLRRPISLYDVSKDEGLISLLYKVVGRGTELMTRVSPHDYVDVMGPLGRGFTITVPQRKALLVGGGVGIAPLVYLARVLKQAGKEVVVFYGCNSRSEAAAAERLQGIGVETILVTLDGSGQYQGLLTPQTLNGAIEPAEADYIYTCGPEPMMAAWTEFARAKGIPGEVSLEEHMACGVGACLGCARKLKKSDSGYAKICKDGPVFSIEQVEL